MLFTHILSCIMITAPTTSSQITKVNVQVLISHACYRFWLEQLSSLFPFKNWKEERDFYILEITLDELESKLRHLAEWMKQYVSPEEEIGKVRFQFRKRLSLPLS